MDAVERRRIDRLRHRRTHDVAADAREALLEVVENAQSALDAVENDRVAIVLGMDLRRRPPAFFGIIFPVPGPTRPRYTLSVTGLFLPGTRLDVLS